jgi:hypothetical protein
MTLEYRRQRNFETAGTAVYFASGIRNPVRNQNQPRQYRSSQLRESRMAVRINPAME